MNAENRALAGPRGAARAPAVWDLGPAAPDDVRERVVVRRRASTFRPHKFFDVVALFPHLRTVLT